LRPAIVTLLFTVYTSTIRLPIHAQLFGSLDSLNPSLPKIMIKEGNFLTLPLLLSDLPDQIVFLITAVQKGGGKCVKTLFPGNARRLKKPYPVAVTAAIFFVENNLPQEIFARVGIIHPQPKTNLISVGLQSIETSFIFHIGMYIGIIEEPLHIVSPIAENSERVDRAWSTAGVE